MSGLPKYLCAIHIVLWFYGLNIKLCHKLKCLNPWSPAAGGILGGVHLLRSGLSVEGVGHYSQGVGTYTF